MVTKINQIFDKCFEFERHLLFYKKNILKYDRNDKIVRRKKNGDFSFVTS